MLVLVQYLSWGGETIFLSRSHLFIFYIVLTYPVQQVWAERHCLSAPASSGGCPDVPVVVVVAEAVSVVTVH